jgi:hypothetical protein
MDQPTGDVQQLFEMIVLDSEIRKAAGGFDNVDYTGENVPSPEQTAAAVEILRKARELRRILRS